MADKKILFFDIDGTLINSYKGQHDIPDTVLAELKRLQGMGHRLFVSSGRPKAMIDQRILAGNFDGYILANGGYVEVQGQSIYEELMDYELAKKTADMLETLGCDYLLETALHIYNDRKYHELYDFFAHSGQNKTFIRDFDRDEILKQTIKIEANVLDEDRQKVEDFIKNDFGYVIAYDEHGTDNAFELYSPTIKKSKGIQKVLDHYQVDVKDSYAFGDGINDLDMIVYCGVGVAMGNAVKELKEVADIVCESIDDDGLTKILKQLF